MAFVNPSINNASALLTEEEKKDIYDRLTKVENDIETLKNVENKTVSNQIDNSESMVQPINEIVDKEEIEEYTELDLPVKEATVNGKPSILNIPIKQEEQINVEPEIASEEKNVDTELKTDEIKEEFTIINPDLYANKIYMTSANQRFGLLNEEQRNNINNINNNRFSNIEQSANVDNSNEILSIDNIMKIS